MIRIVWKLRTRDVHEGPANLVDRAEGVVRPFDVELRTLR